VGDGLPGVGDLEHLVEGEHLLEAPGLDDGANSPSDCSSTSFASTHPIRADPN
jgi:hypothetical protein